MWDHYYNEFDSYNVTLHSTVESRDVPSQGRLGRMAVFAPSGVAAGNADGFTFHNGLRTHNISWKQIEQGPKEEILARLACDFSYVSVIVIYEYSMASLQLIVYLDLISRRVRPGFYDVPFGGIPLIITGDCFQLPVVSGCGIPSSPTAVPLPFHSIYHHCTNGVFCLQLTQSVRQQEDQEYRELLLRMRHASSTQKDVDVLNARRFDDLTLIYEKSPEWYYAPILTARNKSVDALNNGAIFRNGSRLGTFHVHNLPLVRRSKSAEAKKREAQRFYNTKNPTCMSRNVSDFVPPPILVLYPGMPVMLRTNICPSIGLFNGSIGKVVSILNSDKLSAREPKGAVIKRCLMNDLFVPSVLINFDSCYRGTVSALRQADSEACLSQASKIVAIDAQRFNGVYGLPLVPAHSITIHKSQSLTLPFAIIDPRQTFCMGGLYVAFSRSPSLNRIALIAPVSVDILNKYRNSVHRVQKRLDIISSNSSSLEPYKNLVEVRYNIYKQSTVLGAIDEDQ